MLLKFPLQALYTIFLPKPLVAFSHNHDHKQQSAVREKSSNNKFKPLSKLKEFVNNNFEFDENGGKFSEMVEKRLWEKKETASFQQFLLFPQCFQKSCIADMEKPGLVWQRVQ